MDWLTDDIDEQKESTLIGNWKIAIVDDDPEIHKITKLTMNHFEFEDRGLEFISAYSGAEAKQLFQQHDDIAMVLLDVVMEDSHSGLEVAKYIREQLRNHYTRIILRTGQPGFAPEESVIRDYDIDGYKSKTEFTVEHLHLLFITVLRSYRDVTRIQKYQKGLECVIEAMSNLTELDKVVDFAGAIMNQLALVLNSSRTEFIIQDSETFALSKSEKGRYHIMANALNTELMPNGETTESSSEFIELAERALEEKGCINTPPLYAHYHRSRRGTESVFVLRNSQTLSEFNQRLLEIFSHNAVLTLENLIKCEQRKK